MEQIKKFLKFTWRAWKKFFRVLWVALPFFAAQYILLQVSEEQALFAALWIFMGMLLGFYVQFIPNLLKDE